MARFLVDANLPRATAQTLRALGHDAVDVRDIGLVEPDEAIFRYAQLEGRAVITRDLGFGERGKNEPDHYGIVLLRDKNLRSPALIERLVEGLATMSGNQDDWRGHTLLVERGRTRYRTAEL